MVPTFPLPALETTIPSFASMKVDTPVCSLENIGPLLSMPG